MHNNKSYPEIYDKFFTLIRYSINENEEKVDIKPEEWSTLYQMSKEQTLTGVLYNGVKRYDNVPEDLKDQWMAQAVKISLKNKHFNNVAIEIATWFRKNGFNGCLLKGQGNALLYPDPLSRVPGDIDYWLDGNKNEICSFINKKFGNREQTPIHVTLPPFKGVNVEIHYRPSCLYSKKYDERLQKFFDENKDKQMHNFVSLLGTNREIAIPNTEFNRIFLLSHMYRHLIHGGIGLRQLMDYHMLLIRGTSTDLKRETDLLYHLGFYNAASAFLYACNKIFDTPISSMAIKPNKRKGEFVIREIMESGNFGKFDKRDSRKKCESPIKRKINAIKRFFAFIPYFPSVTIRNFTSDIIYKLKSYLRMNN